MARKISRRELLKNCGRGLVALLPGWRREALGAATLDRYPYLQNVRSDRATILWATLENGSGTVRYSSDRTFSRSVPARVREFLPSQTGLLFPYYQYQAELTGLSPGTEYFYQAVLDGQELTPEDELRFRTAGLNPLIFLAFGDSGQGTMEQLRLTSRMLQERPAPALVLHVGDIAYPSGTFSQFQTRHFNVYQNLMKYVPFFPCPGNHEYETNNAGPYLALHAVPTDGVPAADRGRYYSFDFGNVHFIALDSNAPLADAVAGSGRMLEWLENDLRKTRLFWRVVYLHHPPYAGGPNENDPLSAAVRTGIVPILERYGVPLLLNGHEHSYQRSYPLRRGVITGAGTGTVYLTTGGGGAQLYPVFPRPFLEAWQSVHHYIRGEVQGMQMTLRAIGLDGQEIDSVSLAPAPVIFANSTVNAASFSPAIAPGALVSIFGQNLAAAETQVARMPLPTQMVGTLVTLNNQPLPLLYVSPTQINAQLPFDILGQSILRISTSNGSTDSTLVISDAAPAIFSVPGDARMLPAIAHANGALVSPEGPAAPGEQVTIYLTGLGQVNGPIEAGQPAPFSPLLRARLIVGVELGSIPLVPSFAGLAPGFAGLNQVNVEIPQDLPGGTYTLRIVVGNGSRSNAVSLVVRAAVAGGFRRARRPALLARRLPLTEPVPR